MISGSVQFWNQFWNWYFIILQFEITAHKTIFKWIKNSSPRNCLKEIMNLLLALVTLPRIMTDLSSRKVKFFPPYFLFCFVLFHATSNAVSEFKWFCPHARLRCLLSAYLVRKLSQFNILCPFYFQIILNNKKLFDFLSRNKLLIISHFTLLMFSK